MNSRCLTSSPQNRSQTIKARYLRDLDRHFEGSSGGVAGTTTCSVFGGGCVLAPDSDGMGKGDARCDSFEGGMDGLPLWFLEGR